MPVQFFKSFLPTAEDVLQADLPRLGRILLIIVNSWEGSGTVYQNGGGINREYCIAMMEARNIGLGPLLQNQPEYGARQPEVTKRVREAFHWLEMNGYLMPTPNQPAIGWLSFTDAGKELLSKAIRLEQWEKLGLEAVKQGLLVDPLRVIGETPQVRAWAAEWTRLKESQNTATHAIEKPVRGTMDNPSGAGFFFPELGSPSGFLSYSWDSPEHRRWVEGFARRLRGDGVTVILDRWHLKPGDDKFAFMEGAIEQADFVLMICTPMYAQKANQRSGGAGYEATIITPELAGKVSQRKFLHILREGDWEEDAIRKLVKGRIGFDLRGATYDYAQYEALLHYLHDATEPPPPVGPRPDFAGKVSRPEAVPSLLEVEIKTVSQRVAWVVEHLSLASCLYFMPHPSRARIAELMGYDSMDPLDQLTEGRRSLKFEEARQLGQLFGVNQSWLFDGREAPFAASCKYREPFEMFRDFAIGRLTRKDGTYGYQQFIAVVPYEEKGLTHVWGQQDSAGYRNDLLLSSVPLSDHIGSTGARYLFDFCILAAAAQHTDRDFSSYIPKNEQQSDDVLHGQVHLTVARQNLIHSPWIDDIWDFNFEGLEYAPQSLRDARRVFQERARLEYNIRDNKQLFAYIENKLEELRSADLRRSIARK